MSNLKRNLKFYIWVVAGALAISILIPIIRNVVEGENGRVRNFILKAKKAVESQNIFNCANLISKDYSDKYGYDAQALIYLTKRTFGYYKEIYVQIKKIDIELSKDKTEATVEISGSAFGLTEKDEEEIILERETGWLKIKLIKDGKIWQLLEIEDFESLTLMGQKIT